MSIQYGETRTPSIWRERREKSMNEVAPECHLKRGVQNQRPARRHPQQYNIANVGQGVPKNKPDPSGTIEC